MTYRVVAEVTMLVHFVVLAYIVFGGFAAWRWPWAIWPHLIFAAWGFSSVVFGLPCPLTDIEDWARRRAGEEGLSTGFIDTYLTGVIYPEQATSLLRILAAITVAFSWAVAMRRRRHAGEPVH